MLQFVSAVAGGLLASAAGAMVAGAVLLGLRKVAGLPVPPARPKPLQEESKRPSW